MVVELSNPCPDTLHTFGEAVSPHVHNGPDSAPAANTGLYAKYLIPVQVLTGDCVLFPIWAVAAPAAASAFPTFIILT